MFVTCSQHVASLQHSSDFHPRSETFSVSQNQGVVSDSQNHAYQFLLLRITRYACISQALHSCAAVTHGQWHTDLGRMILGWWLVGDDECDDWWLISDWWMVNWSVTGGWWLIHGEWLHDSWLVSERTRAYAYDWWLRTKREHMMFEEQIKNNSIISHSLNIFDFWFMMNDWWLIHGEAIDGDYGGYLISDWWLMHDEYGELWLVVDTYAHTWAWWRASTHSPSTMFHHHPPSPTIAIHHPPSRSTIDQPPIKSQTAIVHHLSITIHHRTNQEPPTIHHRDSWLTTVSLLRTTTMW